MSTVQELEQSIEDAKETIAYGEAVERLNKNKDFKKIVLEGYFTNEAVRLVHAKAEPSLLHPEMQRRLDDDIKAIGIFNNYLVDIRINSNNARASIEQSEQELEGIRSGKYDEYDDVDEDEDDS